jgi:hypothetical protein
VRTAGSEGQDQISQPSRYGNSASISSPASSLRKPRDALSVEVCASNARDRPVACRRGVMRLSWTRHLVEDQGLDVCSDANPARVGFRSNVGKSVRKFYSGTALPPAQDYIFIHPHLDTACTHGSGVTFLMPLV